MIYRIEKAKNGQFTLKLNDIYIYSKYNPISEAEKFINHEFDHNAKGYLLVGLGLGYHLEALMKKSGHKPVIVLALDQQEIKLYGGKKYTENIKIVLELDAEIIIQDYQVIIPLPFIKAIGTEHRLHKVLEDIKIRQMSYESNKELMEENFLANLANDDSSIKVFKDAGVGKWACLVSAGPSLDYSIDLLKFVYKNCFVLAVGSALNTLITHGIMPNAVIITDPQSNVVSQIKNRGYRGMLFYLSTANHQMTQVHSDKKIIMFQKGYPLAEEEANRRLEDTIETGGSVATTGFSLLEYMGFGDIILIGQDLGFRENTHSYLSTSGRSSFIKTSYYTILANSGEYIFSTANLSTYLRWFEKKAQTSSAKIYNTAYNGAKILGIPYINEKELKILLRNSYEFNS